jgi:threonyl-tRNA synthetase
VQVTIVTISDKQMDYAREVEAHLKQRGFRVDLDDRGMTMQAKIAIAQTQKIPFTLVIGDKDKEARAVAPRRYGGEGMKAMPLDAFVELLAGEATVKDLPPTP